MPAGCPSTVRGGDRNEGGLRDVFDASVYLAPLTPLAHFDLVTPQGKGKTSWLPARRVPRLLPSSSGPSATADVQTAFLRRTLLEDVQYSESSGDGLKNHEKTIPWSCDYSQA